MRLQVAEQQGRYLAATTHPFYMQVAEQQGRYLAATLNREAKEVPGWQPSEGFVYRSLGSMASVGGQRAIIELTVSLSIFASA